MRAHPRPSTGSECARRGHPPPGSRPRPAHATGVGPRRYSAWPTGACHRARRSAGVQISPGPRCPCRPVRGFRRCSPEPVGGRGTAAGARDDACPRRRPPPRVTARYAADWATSPANCRATSTTRSGCICWAFRPRPVAKPPRRQARRRPPYASSRKAPEPRNSRQSMPPEAGKVNSRRRSYAYAQIVCGEKPRSTR